MVVVAAMRQGTGMGQQEGSREENKDGREGRRKKARGKKAKEGGVALEGRSGRGWEMVSKSLGRHQLLSGGGSLCTLFFFILSRYSCWDTASTDARISSSSQSFRPAWAKEGKKDDGAPSACPLLALC